MRSLPLPLQLRLLPALRASRGFTLVEFVIVIVILGIIGASSVRLISGPMQGYVDMASRVRLVDIADSSLHRMQRDIRTALPNSVRVTSSGSVVALELVPIVYGGRYRADVPGDKLDTTTADTSFNVLNSTSYVTADLSGLRLAVAPTAAADIYSGTVLTPTATTFTVSSSTVAGVTETLIQLSAGFRFPYSSAQRRFYFVSAPVSYVCDTAAGTLVRYSGYGWNATQSSAPGGTANTLANSVSACSFSFTGGSDKRNAVARLSLTLTDTSSQRVTLMEQVRVNNAP